MTAWGGIGEVGMAWAGAVLLHGAILMLLSWGLSLLLAGRDPILEDAAWKAALVGSLVTATVQVALPMEPWLGRWDPRRASLEPSMALDPVPWTAVATTSVAAEVETAMPAWVLWGLAWAVGFGMSVSVLVMSGVRLRARLSDRRTLADPAVVGILRRLELGAGVRRPTRLSVSDKLETPVAWGIRRAEICLPQRVVQEMDGPGIEAVLAHELAHVVRRDPAWLLAFLLVESGLFFQPLYRVARRRWIEASEVACDDWAIARTRRPEVLARRLADVASWILDDPSGPVPAMARPGSPLGRRIRRLLGETPAPAARPWARAALLAVLAIVALGAPGIGTARGRTPRTPPPPPPLEAPNAAPPEAAELPELPMPPDAPEGEVPEAPETPDLPELPELPEGPVVAVELPEAELAMALEEAALAQALGHESLTQELQQVLERIPTAEQLEQIRAEVRRAVEESRRAMREQSSGLREAQREMERGLARARADMDRARREAERERATEHRERSHHEIEEARRELERERARLEAARAELEEERRQLEEERARLQREQQEAPAPPDAPEEVR